MTKQLKPAELKELEAWWEAAGAAVGLGGWQFFVSRQYADEGCDAACYLSQNNRVATLRVGESLFGMCEREVRRVLCHELGHIVLDRLTNAAESEGKVMPYHAVEETCTAIGDLLVSLVPEAPKFLVGDRVPGDSYEGEQWSASI